MDSTPIDDPSLHTADGDEWDADGFVIPSIAVRQPDLAKPDVPTLNNSQNSSFKAVKDEENIYLGPHGAPPRVKQQELNSTGRKQRLKNKLKEADKRFSGPGRENKVENLRELVGSKVGVKMTKSSPRDWLDPHCHESLFEKSH
ncbi:uncharacterized protein LOC116258335 isoform X2 [Nymphaea colorata]|uniref:uncharacterized protein LOC116258335 isoform X2 n=1 Tax=Nymphaea colorata TaxID=210225 RepID=UPI00129DF48B|nr:uncharacterized protein LOC116258335 isoform X2 [Nymphaea colorata]